MADIYLISDTHFGDENIIKFCKRPFKDAKEMDDVICENWNRTVRPQDKIYHLGDVTMDRDEEDVERFVRRMRMMNGHMRLVHGNHDHFATEIYLEAGFEKILGMWRGVEDLLFTHAPVHTGSIGTAKANIHGHIHDHPSPEPVVWAGYKDKPLKVPRIQPYINVCVEWTNYRPIHVDEVHARIRVAIEKWWAEHGEEWDVANGKGADVRDEGRQVQKTKSAEAIGGD